MCGSKPPKPKSPPPPPPPAAEAPEAPAFDGEDRRLEGERNGAARRRLGRSALRIDLQAPSGGGVQIPSK